MTIPDFFCFNFFFVENPQKNLKNPLFLQKIAGVVKRTACRLPKAPFSLYVTANTRVNFRKNNSEKSARAIWESELALECFMSWGVAGVKAASPV